MFRPIAAVSLCCALCACGSAQPNPSLPPIPDQKDAPKTDPSLPAVPTTVASEIIEPLTGHTPSARSPILDVMVAENARWMKALPADEQEPAYYLAYTVYEKRSIVIEAEGGALLTSTDDTGRALDVEVRVGSPELDNRHQIPNDRMAAFANLPDLGRMPFGDDPLAIARHLWLETDRRYHEAALQYRYIQTQRQVIAQRDQSADFAHHEASTYIQPKATIAIDKAAWEDRMRDCSARAMRGVATQARCRIDVEAHTVYFVSSEGTVLQQSWPRARMMVSVGVKADDGMPLSRTEQAFAPMPEGLPDRAGVSAMIDTVVRELGALHKAPVVAPYVGPAILQGRAAAVFFHEVFGHRVEGHRQEQETSGQTFASYVGKQIMPAWLTVYDDPRIFSLAETPLNGFYHFDSQGVPAQRALLVDKGVLKGFLLGRNPIAGFDQSNGHGRKEPGQPPTARQGNLVVEAARSVTQDELLDRLIAEIKRQKKPYGMLFTDISGGYTNTSTFAAQAFKVSPVMAYRVYPDGRKELVRGVDIVGTPLSALGSIAAAARPLETFNGICGAESGWVPVSASAPSLLLTQLEVERSFKPTDRPPVLAPPPSGLREDLKHRVRGNPRGAPPAVVPQGVNR